MKKLLLSVVLSLLFLFSFYTGDETFAQQRNPVLEEFTGTWCPWCPCGHDIMEDIANAIPNAILIGYHGPANGSDPFSFFSGNSVIGMLSPPFWPSGATDRTGAPGDRGLWLGQMTARNSVPATVAIDVSRTFNPTTREFNATIDFTALTNLNGQYKFTVILLESGMVWNQAGNGSCTGGANYVHKHVVRDMMNGPTGEEIVNGTWNMNDVITKTVNHIIPSPGGTGPDMVWDNCDIVVIVHEAASPLYNGEIQQAEEMTLISPDYLATIATISPDVIGDNNTPVIFDAVIYNEGLLTDKYEINLDFEGPSGWALEFTTENGTFPMGQIDSVEVNSGDSTVITVNVDPSGINGSGQTTLNFVSKYNVGNQGSVTMRNVTNSEIDILVIDASEDGYASAITNSLDGVASETYGVVSRSALHAMGVDLTHFYMVTWSSGISVPAFYPEEVSVLENYLDAGGRLFINGQDIGADIFEPTGQSQFAQSFYNNYLHADYVANSSFQFLLNGFSGDPISDGIQIVLGLIYDKEPDEIAAFDTDATPIFQYLSGPKIGGLRVASVDYRVVYLPFGMEQLEGNYIDERDTIMARSVRWLMENTVLSTDNNNAIVKTYSLEQNYPNPFNPSTTINYSLANEEHVSLNVYDIMGREVAELVNENQAAGTYSLDFDASSLASGMYFYKITAGNFVSTKKMVLLK